MIPFIECPFQRFPSAADSMQPGMANPSVAKLYVADCKRRTGACWITVSQLTSSHKFRSCRISSKLGWSIKPHSSIHLHRKLFILYVCMYVCYVMLCYVMLCYAMLCYAMLCYVMLCYVMYVCMYVYINIMYAHA